MGRSSKKVQNQFLCSSISGDQQGSAPAAEMHHGNSQEAVGTSEVNLGTKVN